MPLPNKQFPPVTIIGAGAVGTSIALTLFKNNYRIVSVISRTKTSAHLLARQVECPIASNNYADISPETGLIVIAVPDNAISAVDRKLSTLKILRWNSVFVLHTSGIHPASSLQKTAQRGAATAALHPIQTFPVMKGKNNTPHSSLQDIYFGVDCKKIHLPFVRTLIKRMHAKMVIIPAGKKPLYHAACVFSSGYVVILANALQELSSSLGMKDRWFEIFEPLWNTALSNTIRLSAGSALTGPVLRHDLETIETHINAIEKFAPELIPFYTVCGIEVTRLAREKKRISTKQYNELVKVFKNATGISRRRIPKNR